MTMRTAKRTHRSRHTPPTRHLHTQISTRHRLPHPKCLYHPLQYHAHRYRHITRSPRSLPPRPPLLSRFPLSAPCPAMREKTPPTRLPGSTTSVFYDVRSKKKTDHCSCRSWTPSTRSYPSSSILLFPSTRSTRSLPTRCAL